MLKFLKTLVVPQVEYGCIIWMPTCQCENVSELN